jgi:endopeptidase La
MEIIMLAGYTEEEKVQIALRHLVPRQLKEHGLTTEQLDFERDGLETVIRGYTREAGVRSLDRQIATISRKVARKVAEAQGPEPVAAAALAPTEVLPEATVDSQPVALAPVVDIAPAPAAVAVVEEAPAAPAEVAAAPAETSAEPAIVPEPTPAIDPVHVTALTVVDYLGARRFSDSLKEEADEVGLVTGLAWTETGGDVLTVEATVMEGGPAGQLDLVLTGQLGNVMQESARTALSFVRSHAGDLGIDPALFTEHTLHVHVPAGAIPKDGPSAGVTMATAIASALSGRPVNRDVAMTGEVTLRGRVLPIGGLKEKTLAAHRFGVTAVLFPKENERDLDEIPKEIRAELELVPVERMHEVLDRALHPAPAALALPLTKVS